MVRRPHGSGSDAIASGEIFEARILTGDPANGTTGQGRVVEYWIEGIDAGGNLNAFSSGSPDTTSAAAVRQLIATGPVVYASKTGNDNNSGSKSYPKLTINAALDALAASANNGKNGGVIVGPGEWHERLTLDATRFPTDGDFHFLEGDGTNRDSTILCGAHPLVEQGLWAPGKPFKWVSTGQDSMYKAYFPAATGPADSVELIVIGWGEQLHRKTSIKAVLDDSTFAYTFASPNGIGSGELSGWFWQHDTLYVKRRNGRSPSGQALHFGYLDRMIIVKRRNWRIANLSIRYAGGPANDMTYRANVNPGMNGTGIQAGLQAMGSGLVLDSLRIYGTNAPSIYIPHGAGGFEADSVVIANCLIDGLSIGAMSPGAGKSRSEEAGGQIQLNSRASSVINTRITGTYNGIVTTAGAADSTAGSQCELVNNTITNVAEDAFEWDLSHGINSLFAGNTSRNTGRAFSEASTFTGPLFLFFNTFSNFSSAGIKGGGGAAALARYQQNTITSSVAGAVSVDLSATGSTDGLLFENNILGGSGVARSMLAGPSSGGSTATNQFNWNLMDSTATSVATLARWNGADLTLSTLRSSLNWEKNGIQRATAFVDSAQANLSLGAFTFTTGKGRRITGVNTGLDGNRYGTQGPDMGAILRVTP
jgi:hypothetical protein